MADFSYSDAGFPASDSRDMAGPGISKMAGWAGAAVSLALISSVGVWGYKVLARDVSGIPVVRALSDPMRVAPDNPGGTLAHHQGLAVNDVAGTGTAAGPADRLVLAPRPAGLSEEDVAQGLIAARAVAKDAPRPVAVQPAPDLAAPPELTADQDPVAALVAELTAGATPLTDIAEQDPTQNTAQTGATPAIATGPTETASPDPSAPDADPLPPGLAKSLRPKLRPTSFRTAALNDTAVNNTTLGNVTSDAAPSGPATNVQELDADSLTHGTRLAQIGAFDSPDRARAEWDRLDTRFGEYLDGHARVIQKASSGGRVFYRLRAHGFEDLADARRFCSAFVARGVDCIPVVSR